VSEDLITEARLVDRDTSPGADPADVQVVADALDEFAWDVYRATVAEHPDEANVFLSPASMGVEEEVNRIKR